MRYLEDEERTHRDRQTQREEGQETVRAGRQGLEAMARTAGSCPKQEEAKKHSSQEERTCQHLNFRVLGSRTVEEYISVVLSHPVCGILFCQPWEQDFPGYQPVLVPAEFQDCRAMGCRGTPSIGQPAQLSML